MLDQLESKLLKTPKFLQSFNLLYGLRTLRIISSSGLIVKTFQKHVKKFMTEFHNFDPNIKFT